VELIQDHLAKGCTLWLARWPRGGWRRERFIRGDQVKDGRLWERSAPKDMGLVFSRHALRFLLWITANKPTDAKANWSAPEKDLTPADCLLFYLAYTALRETEIAKHLKTRPGFAGNSLLRLAFPEEFAVSGPGETIDYGPWVTGVGAIILEAMQPELTERWVASERAKSDMADWDKLRAHGRCQEAVLDAFLQAVETAGRRDLARFLLQASSRLLTNDATAQNWVNAKAASGVRLADRVETYRAALALVNRVERFRRWEQQARNVGYLDEGYAASQLMKADWEGVGGEQLAGCAQRIARELDPLSLPSEGRS
jgi:hypothetical protein